MITRSVIITTVHITTVHITTVINIREFNMAKQVFAAVALAALAVFVTPATAVAADETSLDKNISVSGDASPGSILTVSVSEGSFDPGETVAFASTGSGSSTESAANDGTVSRTKTATAAGAARIDVAVPPDATGTYTVTGTGVTSGSTGTVSIDIPGTDLASTVIAGGPASTAENVPMLLAWGGAGVFIFATALVIVMNIVRRQRATA